MQKVPSLNLVYRHQDLQPTYYTRDIVEALKGNQDEDHQKGPIIFTLNLAIDDCLKLYNLYELGLSQQVENCDIRRITSRPIKFSISYMHEDDELSLYDFAACVDILCLKDFRTGNSTSPSLLLVLYQPYREDESITAELNMKEILNFLKYHNKLNACHDN